MTTTKSLALALMWRFCKVDTHTHTHTHTHKERQMECLCCCLEYIHTHKILEYSNGELWGKETLQGSNAHVDAACGEKHSRCEGEYRDEIAS